jgi:hypothetical protein
MKSRMKIATLLSLAAAAGLQSGALAAPYDELAVKGYRWVTIDGPYACPSKDDLRLIIKHRAALGGVVWGFCGQVAGVSVALVFAAIAVSVCLYLVARLSINFTTSLSFDPPPISCVMSPLVYDPQPRDGAVAITFKSGADELRKGNAHETETRVR